MSNTNESIVVSVINECGTGFRLPSSLRKSAAEMIVAMLQSNPECRPSVFDLLGYEFLTTAFIPTHLPVSCLTMAPRDDQLEGGEVDVGLNRKPLTELHDNMGMIFVNIKKNELIIISFHVHCYRRSGWRYVPSQEST